MVLTISHFTSFLCTSSLARSHGWCFNLCLFFSLCLFTLILILFPQDNIRTVHNTSLLPPSSEDHRLFRLSFFFCFRLVYGYEPKFDWLSLALSRRSPSSIGCLPVKSYVRNVGTTPFRLWSPSPNAFRVHSRPNAFFV